jgi:hypothetical protein
MQPAHYPSQLLSPVTRWPRLGVAAALACTLALVAGLPAGAYAARPMITDDARIVDEGACQLETWVRRADGASDLWALPACNFGADTELSLGFARLAGEAGNESTDIVLQAKHLLRPLERDGWGSAVVVGYATRRALSPSRDLLGDFYATLLNSFAFTQERFVLHTNLGYLHLREVHADRATWGVGAEAMLTPAAWLIAESFGQNVGKPWWQAGLRFWVVPQRVQLDATVGERWGGGERWVTIGLRLLSPPFLR